MTETQAQGITKRLNRIEKHNRFMKLAGCCIVVLFAAVLLAGANKDEAVKETSGQQPASIDEMRTDEHPTKEEWLEVYTCHEIREVTDLWKQRISVTVAVIQKSKEFVVTLTSANGQEELSGYKKNVYAQYAERIVKGILEEYKWAKDYKLTVQYI